MYFRHFLGFAIGNQLTPDDPVNYDTKPGSRRAGYIELLDLDGWDEIFADQITYFDSHTFVPSESSLDLYSGEIPVVEISDPDNPDPGNYPFDAYFAQSTNEKHIEITPGNIAWTMEQVQQNEYELTDALPDATMGTTYNYGENFHHILHSLEVNDEGHLQINGDYYTQWGSGPVPPLGSTFTVNTGQCGVIININDGGLFEIGDDNFQGHNKGILNLYQNTRMTVKSGGILKIHKGSILNIKHAAILIIEPGGLIEVEDGAVINVEENGSFLINDIDIHLNGVNARIALQGNGNIITTNVDFTIIGSGYFDYYKDGELEIDNGYLFKISGTGKEDRKVVIEEDADLFVEGNDVQITNCQFQIHEGAKFRVEENDVTVSGSKFIGIGELGYYGIHATSTWLFEVTSSDFTNLFGGIKLIDITSCPDENMPYIGNCQFTDHIFGIEAYNVGLLEVANTSITGTLASSWYGLTASDITDLHVLDCSILNHTIDMFGLKGTGVFMDDVAMGKIDGTSISNNIRGIDGYSSNIYIRNHAIISSNDVGINAQWIDFGGNAPSEQKKIVVGDEECGWIINNTTAGVKGTDMVLEVDQWQHALAADLLEVYPNRFDGNGQGFDVCYYHFNEAEIGSTIYAFANYWGGGFPSSAYNDVGFDEGSNPCDNATLYAAVYSSIYYTNCTCMNPWCPEDYPYDPDGYTERIATTSCGTTIPKKGGGRISIADQYRSAYLAFNDEQYQSAYNKFDWLVKKTDQENPNGVQGICRHLYSSAKSTLPMILALAEAHCLSLKEESDTDEDYSRSELKLYPNPAESSFNLILEEKKYEGARLNISNEFGQVVYTDIVNSLKSEININTWDGVRACIMFN